jgi:hypothetical protein
MYKRKIKAKKKEYKLLKNKKKAVVRTIVVNDKN